MVRSRKIEELKSSLKLTREQREILIGLLLGDAHLESNRSDRTFRLKIEQSKRHEAYVDHLADVFRDWVLTGPRLKSRSTEGRSPTISYAFQTVSHSAFRFYAHQFYRGGKKSIPKLIHRWLTPRAIAYWFMDDGSIKSRQSKGVLFNTQGFDKAEVELLARVLKSNFDLRTSLRNQPEGFQIYVSGRSYERFVELTSSFVIDSMRYKIPPARRTTMPKE